eukprot:CAMPEP_0119007252 /NCGR_PEP_ID=MMETSP1176-20130426/2889_1 /TAXON_ID=265551 /ORGANISM="Synedropsis recta cf, Strain CCMP1620" /LENGTH=376 /DNA_ID=CAMNT_0006959367 /DNA_START=82 /DNA_END=1209 /DNA_ORIENTATION=-
MSSRMDPERASARRSKRGSSSSVRNSMSRSNNYVGNYLNKSILVALDEDEQHEDEPSSQYSDFTLGENVSSEDNYFGRLRNMSGKFVNSFVVQAIMTCIIIGNAILLGVLTLDVVRSNPGLMNALEWLDIAILISFTVEFGFQFFYLGPVFIRQTWLVFDFVVIVFSWIFVGSSASVLRAFRIFRVFSLASKWTSMQKLFTAVGSSLPKMGVVASLLLLLFYAFSVLCTVLYSPLYDEGYLDYDYFGRLDLTFITLFQMLTTDTWLVIVRQVMDARPYSYILFFFWVSLTAIIIINLIIAIICESLIQLKDEATEAEAEDASIAFRAQVPVEALIRQQQDITSVQVEMELAINALMLRLPGGTSAATQSTKGTARA